VTPRQPDCKVKVPTPTEGWRHPLIWKMRGWYPACMPLLVLSEEAILLIVSSDGRVNKT
jgi:hypothetical protein